jgi:general secretion pathway protein G
MMTIRTSLRGFTLIELLVVLAIVALLLTLAAPRYLQSIDASRETLLIENLRITRNVIDSFLADTGRYPESLDELVERRYLRTLPHDPVLDDATAWQVVPVPSSSGIGGAVFDLRSSAPGTTRDGIPYADL